MADSEMSTADIQLEYLRAAISSVDAAVSGMAVDPDSPVGELHAKAAHLVGCAAALDDLCSNGTLPGDWGGPRRVGVLVTDGPSLVELDAAPAFPLLPRPAGFWGRIELPGMRHYTGWIAEEERFGMKGAVVRDWDGRETHFVIPGPNSPVYHLLIPAQRPDDSWDPF